MPETSEPQFEPPFTVKVDGKVVHEGIHSQDRAVELVGPLALKHRRSRVQAFDRYGREIAHALEERLGEPAR